MNNLSNVYCFSSDSFLLTYTYHGYSFEENLNDSMLYVLKIDNNNILTFYNLPLPKSKYFCLSKSDFNDTSYVYPSFSNNKLIVLTNKLFIPYKRLSTINIGTKTFVNTRLPIYGMMDIKQKKIFDADFFDFPYIIEGIYYPNDIKEKYYCSNDKNIFIRYFYSNNIFAFDSNAHYLYKKELKSLLIDSIYPFSEARSNHWGMETINAMYLQLQYDPFRKLFYSYVYFPYQRYGKGFFSLIIADSSLNYINELVDSIKISYNSIFTEKYIITISIQEGKIKLNYYQPISKQIAKEEFDNYIKSTKDTINKMEIKEKNKICNIIPSVSLSKVNKISDYIVNVQKINEPTFASIYLYTDMVCESCIHNVLFDFMINNKNYEKLPIYLHLSGTSKTINKLTKQYYLKNFKKMYIDTNMLYKYFDPFNNATVRMVLFSKKKIISDTIYYGKGLDTMMNRCFHFFENNLE